MAWCVCTSALASFVLASRVARADETDGVYGRLRADTVLSIEASGGLALTVTGPRGALLATARARALDTAGLFVSYGYAFGTTRYDALAAGVELRPMMLGRIFSDLEHGPHWLDLLIDSIGIEMGLAWLRPGESWRAGSGLGFVLGSGAELPLRWHDGNGLMARLGVRWVHAASWDAQNPGEGPSSGESLFVTLGLSGRAMVRIGHVRER